MHRPWGQTKADDGLSFCFVLHAYLGVLLTRFYCPTDFALERRNSHGLSFSEASRAPLWGIPASTII